MRHTQRAKDVVLVGDAAFASPVDLIVLDKDGDVLKEIFNVNIQVEKFPCNLADVLLEWSDLNRTHYTQKIPEYACVNVYTPKCKDRIYIQKEFRG